jgi:Spy/CpxP family protein refolding chaperone
MAADSAKEAAKTEAVKAPEAAKAEAPKPEAPKTEAPKTEAPKAEEPKKAEDSKKAILEGPLADMVRECKLSDEQQAKLAQAVIDARAEAEAWQKTNAAKLEASRKAVQAAQDAGDQEATKKAYIDSMSLREETRALMMKHQNAIVAILTPEQRVAWQGYRLFVDVVSDLKAIVKLTDEQAPKVRPICEEAAQSLAAIKDEGEAGMKARMAVQEKLLTGIKEKVLTPEQRTMLDAKLAPPEKPAEKAPAPAAEKSPAPAAEKPAAEKAPAPAAEKPAAEKPAAEAPAPAPAPKAEK